MSVPPGWQADVVRWLRQLENAVLLKTSDPIATLQAGGDLDLLVGDPAAAEASLIREVGRPLFRARYGYFYEWGHIDLIPRIEWRGAAVLQTGATLAAARMTADGFRVADPASNALLFWLRPIIWGGFFKSGCETLVEQAMSEDASAFRHLLVSTFGSVEGQRIFDLAGQAKYAEAAERRVSLRRALWLRAILRRPFGTIGGLWHHIVMELRLRFRPPLPWIAVLGPDGSGKSTVLNAVCELLRPVIPHRQIFHWRPAVLRPANPEAGPVIDPHGQIPRSMPVSLLKLLFLLVDWWLGYWRRIVPLSARLTFCLFDRCYVDLLVDPRRYRYGGPMSLARWMGALVPQPALVILLDAPAEVLQARKREVSLEETQRQVSAYRALVSAMPGGRIVNCARPVPEVAGEVRDLLLQMFRERSS
jgi:thymidylate kinase